MTAVAADVALRQLTTTVGLSQLLGDEHLAEFKDWQRTNRDSQAPEAIVWLIDQGWVTRWQGQQLLAGNHSFFLRHYKLVNRLGGGGMGTVFQAIDDRSGRIVAVKILRKSALQRPNTLERFRREIAALGKLRHPNIVAAYEAGQLSGYHYLVMEYIEGRDLGYWISKFKRLPIEMACEIARQAALGLDHAHRLGFLHRDIKPSNLIAVRKPDGGLDVRILDFGLARNFDGASEEARVTKAGQIVGTVDYLAPEQAQGSNSVDGRADVYSLGVTLFEMAAGQPPFGGATMMARLVARVMHPAPLLSEFVPDAPPTLVDAISKALSMRAEDRFQTAGEFAAALEHVEADAKKAASSATTVEMPAPSLEGVAESTRRTPETAAPIYDEFQKALTDKAQETGDSQQFAFPSWMKRRPLWIAAGVAAVLLVLITAMFSRGSKEKTGASSTPGAAAPSPIEALSREAAALAERPDPARVQRLWKEIWSLTDVKNGGEVRAGALALAATAPHPLDATFAKDEIQRTVYKAGFFESLGAAKRVRRLALSPDGRTAASLTDHGVLLHDLVANVNEELTADELHSPSCLAFSPSGDSLAVGAHDGAIHLFEMNGRTRLQIYFGRGSANNVGFIRDGTGIVSTHASKTVVAWKSGPNSGEKSFDLPHAPTTLAFIPNTDSIVVGSNDGRTTMLDLKSGAVETNGIFKSTVVAADSSPDGKHVVVLGWEAVCMRIEGSSFTQVWSLPSTPGSKWVAEWSSPSRERLATLASNGVLQIRSWKTGEVDWERDALEGSRQAAALAVSPEGRFAAVQAKDGGIELVKLPSIKQ